MTAAPPGLGDSLSLLARRARNKNREPRIPMRDTWIADRMHQMEASGIRKVFDLARSLKDPINLSIGQPHFDVPEPIKAAAHAAIDRGANAYTVSQGIADLRAKLPSDVRRHYDHPDREL